MVTSGYRPIWLDSVVHLRFDGIIHRRGIVRAPNRNLQCFTLPRGPVRDPQGCRTAPLPARKGIDATRIYKNPARASYVAVRGPHGPITVPTWAVHGLIMHALKLYGPCTVMCDVTGAYLRNLGTCMIDSGYGMAPNRHQAITWIIADVLSIRLWVCGICISKPKYLH